MGRPPRIHFEGAVHHVVHRGNFRQAIFLEDQDRICYLRLLRYCVENHTTRLLAYCLMGNHVHLVLRAGATPVSRTMLILGSTFSRHLNARLGRTGHLFQGRFHSVLVRDDAQLLQTVRYVSLNPVRAALAPTPEAYEWSSHLAYLGLRTCTFLDTDVVLSLFGPTLPEARSGYARFVSEGPPEPVESDGDPGPCPPPPTTAEIHPGVELDTILRATGQACGLPPAAILAPGKQRGRAEARALAACVALDVRCVSLTEFAQRSGRSVSGLCRAVQQVRARVLRDPALAGRIARIRASVEKSTCEA